MLRALLWATATGIAVLHAPVRADAPLLAADGPASKRIDIAARASAGALDDCRLTGEAVLWVSRRVDVRDRARAGAMTAGLAQFGPGTRLGGCVPDGAALNLADQFATFVVAERSDAPARRDATALASRLAQDVLQLTEADGSVIPVVDGVTLRGTGSATYRFRIVLVVDASSGRVDAVILRETLGTKFAPRLGEDDRRASRLKWSSAP